MTLSLQFPCDDAVRVASYKLQLTMYYKQAEYSGRLI